MRTNRFRVTYTVVFILIAGCSSRKTESLDSLVQDPSLEETSLGQTLPTGWENLSAAENGCLFSIIDGGRTGKHCVELEPAGKQGVVQFYRNAPEKGQRYRGKCWIQFPGKPDSKATLRLQYVNRQNEIAAQSEVSLKGTDAKAGWNLLAVRDQLPNSKSPLRILFSIAFEGTGAVEVDDIELVTDPSLAIQRNLLPNGEMENVAGTQPVGWRMSKSAGDAIFESSDESPFEGWHTLHLKGKVEWAVIGSDKINIDRRKSYVLSGFIRTQSGSSQLKIDYFKRGKYLGSSESPGTYANTWKNEVLVWQPERFPDADQITAAAVGCGETNAWFDKLVLQEQ